MAQDVYAGLLRYCVKAERKSKDADMADFIAIIFKNIKRQYFAVNENQKGFNENTIHARIFDFCKTYYEKYGVRPNEAQLISEINKNRKVKPEVREQFEAVVDQVFSDYAEVEEFYPSLNKVKKVYAGEAVMSFFVDNVVEAEDFEGLAESMVDFGHELQDTLREDSSKRVRGTTTMQELMKEYHKNYKSKEIIKNYIPWPYKSWNESWLLGPVKRGEVTVIGAVENSGKSFWLHDLAYRWIEQGYIGAVSELEMLYQQTQTRFAARLANTEIYKAENPHKADEKTQRRILNRIAKLYKTGLFANLVMLDQDEGLTPTGLELAIRRKFGTTTPDFIIIDFYTLMKPDDRSGGSDWNEKEQLIKELKLLAERLNCHIVTATHLNADQEARYKSVLNTADCVLYLSADDTDPYLPPKGDRTSEPGLFNFYARRNRSGNVGVTVSCYMDFAKSQVKDAPMLRNKVADAVTFDRPDDDTEDFD